MYRLEGFDYSLPYYYMVTLKKREGIAPFSRNIEGTPTPNAATRRASTKNSAPQAARYSSHFGRPRQRNSTSRRCTNAATNSEISPPRRLGERRFRKPSQIPQPNVEGKPEVETATESYPSRWAFFRCGLGFFAQEHSAYFHCMTNNHCLSSVVFNDLRNI